MNILVFGATGFIGTNLARRFAQDKSIKLTLVDAKYDYFKSIIDQNIDANIVVSDFFSENDFDRLVAGNDYVFHLASSVIPGNSNKSIPQELATNVESSIKLFESCIKHSVKRLIFFSSGGAVYGMHPIFPLKEDYSTYPITTYGLQKITIEKLLFLYHHLYNLDYRVVRLSNPYGPYQRPNSGLGALTTFLYRVLNHQTVDIFGDGSVVRDFIYIDDVIDAVQKISFSNSIHHTYNIGSGIGIKIIDLISLIEKELNMKARISFQESRKVDIPVNYLDISRYTSEFGPLAKTDISHGIALTAEFFKKHP